MDRTSKSSLSWRFRRPLRTDLIITLTPFPLCTSASRQTKIQFPNPPPIFEKISNLFFVLFVVSSVAYANVRSFAQDASRVKARDLGKSSGGRDCFKDIVVCPGRCPKRRAPLYGHVWVSRNNIRENIRAKLRRLCPTVLLSGSAHITISVVYSYFEITKSE